MQYLLVSLKTNFLILQLVSASAQYYFNSATVFWLTVISFDVWWKFRLVVFPDFKVGFWTLIHESIRPLLHYRRIQSNRPNNAKEYAKARFLRYSICAWCGSIIVPSIELGCLIWLDVAGELLMSSSWTKHFQIALTMILVLIQWLQRFYCWKWPASSNNMTSATDLELFTCVFFFQLWIYVMFSRNEPERSAPNCVNSLRQYCAVAQ